MPTRVVTCERMIGQPDAVWQRLRGFDLSWHPMIADCTVARGIRRFRDTTGQVYSEQLMYRSDADRVLRYRLIDGIAGCDDYRAELHVNPDGHVRWRAQITATDARLPDIADGTRAAFEAALDALPLIQSGTIGRDPLLRYTSTTEKAQTIAVCLHGIGGNGDNWQCQLSALADFPIVALNLRGYGGSPLGRDQTSIVDYCNDILAVMTHFNASRVVLVGLSMGAWIATSFAMRHPDRLAGIMLAGGCTGMSEAPAAVRDQFRAARLGPLDAGQTPADFAPMVVDTIAGPQASDAVRSALTTSMAAIPASTYRDALMCYTNPVEQFDLGRVTCPALLVTGFQDRLAPPDEIRSVAARIINAPVRFEILHGAGHVCNLEAPNRFNRLLRSFLHGLDLV